MLLHVPVLQIVSTMGTTRLEDVAEASKGSPLLIFQLYVQRDREFTASLLRSKHLQFLELTAFALVRLSIGLISFTCRTNMLSVGSKLCHYPALAVRGAAC